MQPRLIKFRAWDRNLRRMWQWEELQSLPMSDFQRTDLLWSEATGLVDGRKREIWEGDIAQFSTSNEFGSLERRIGVMEMTADGAWAFNIGECSTEVQTTSPPLVVGNVYEHSHLLDLGRSHVNEKEVA